VPGSDDPEPVNDVDATALTSWHSEIRSLSAGSALLPFPLTDSASSAEQSLAKSKAEVTMSKYSSPTRAISAKWCRRVYSNCENWKMKRPISR